MMSEIQGARDEQERGFLGILMLETQFERPPGDIGNPATFDFPIRYAIVPGASPERVVHRRADGLLPAFVAAATELCAQGALGIATSCGFLALFQKALSAAVPAPVATSSLLQVAVLQALLPPSRTVGVVTIDASALGADHLLAVGARPDIPIEAVAADSHFAQTILENRPGPDLHRAEQDVVTAASRLVRRVPSVAAIVLECANMPPYSAAVARATGRPVYDAATLLRWFWSGLSTPAARGAGQLESNNKTEAKP